MAGCVNQGRKGWTELRVHGVSGTPPDRMLQHAQIEMVAGDTDAGFFRRRYDAPAVSDDDDQQRAEAYSWGGLTAGAGARALWLLLAPFMLANLAFFALPRVTAGGKGWRRWPAVVPEALVRLFALSVTVTFVLVPVQVAMDLIGWQCVRPGLRDCTAQTSWLGFLQWRWLATPGGRLAVTALVPLLVVVLLWRLGRSTWLRLENTTVPGAVAAETDQTPLEDRNMWNGREPVRRLRAVHLAAALAVVGVFLVAPLRLPVATGVLWLLTAALALAAVLVCVPATSRRTRPGETPGAAGLDRYTAFPLVVAVVVLVAVFTAGFAGRGSFREEPSLPGLAGAVQGLFTAQLVLLLLLAGLLLRLRRTMPPPEAVGPVQGRTGEAYEDRPAWGGLAAAALMMLALAFIGEVAAGAGIRIADLLGAPAVDYENPSSFLVPGGYFSAAAVTAVLVLALLVAALAGWRHVAREATSIESGFEDFYDDAAGEAHAGRRRAIAGVWARAEVGEVAQRLAGWLLVVAAVVLAAGLAVFWLDPTWLLDHARWLVNVGTFLVVGFLLLLLYVGRQAYQNANFRRTVGVLWDVGTFWPRAAHPLAPPCYTERTVPDLMTRIRYLGDRSEGGKVLLSCHSQGTIIGAAVIMQLTYDESAPVAFLTYGSPLRRLYCRFFPQYFNVRVINRTGSFLLGCAHENTPREHRPWRNLHRRSDPIGGPLLITYPPRVRGPGGLGPLTPAGDNGDLDRQLIDPRFDRPDGDTCDPAPCGHSNYFADPAFADSVTTLRELRDAYPSVRGRCPGNHSGTNTPLQPPSIVVSGSS
ncbi:hypothetical protein [Actinoplanes sp. NPDC049316]|uniref:hypothetical protein n=1 Tax=Actinoplanes sp. NPDC049316 TaxID=3154727 RepID=UPI003444F371